MLHANTIDRALNEAVEAGAAGLAPGVWLAPDGTPCSPQEIAHAVLSVSQRTLPVLFAAWQEQAAAKAGEVGAPVEDAPGESILRESCVWFEDYDDRNYGPMVTLPDARRAIVAGAAAGVAASEERIRRAEETRENANAVSLRVELENQRLKERLGASETRVRELREALEWIADAERAEDADALEWATEAHERAQSALAALLSEEPADG